MNSIGTLHWISQPPMAIELFLSFLNSFSWWISLDKNTCIPTLKRGIAQVIVTKVTPSTLKVRGLFMNHSNKTNRWVRYRRRFSADTFLTVKAVIYWAPRNAQLHLTNSDARIPANAVGGRATQVMRARSLVICHRRSATNTLTSLILYWSLHSFTAATFPC